MNIVVEFSAEELETALLTPNTTLDDIHIPILKVSANFLHSLLLVLCGVGENTRRKLGSLLVTGVEITPLLAFC